MNNLSHMNMMVGKSNTTDSLCLYWGEFEFSVLKSKNNTKYFYCVVTLIQGNQTS